jgi:hypothetical protein
MVFEADETRSRFAELSGRVALFRGRFFDREAVGSNGMNCVITGQRAMGVVEGAAGIQAIRVSFLDLI